VFPPPVQFPNEYAYLSEVYSSSRQGTHCSLDLQLLPICVGIVTIIHMSYSSISMTGLVAACRYLFEFRPVNTELIIPSQLIVEGPVSQPQCLIHFLLTVALIISSCLTAI